MIKLFYRVENGYFFQKTGCAGEKMRESYSWYMKECKMRLLGRYTAKV